MGAGEDGPTLVRLLEKLRSVLGDFGADCFVVVFLERLDVADQIADELGDEEKLDFALGDLFLVADESLREVLVDDCLVRTRKTKVRAVRHNRRHQEQPQRTLGEKERHTARETERRGGKDKNEREREANVQTRERQRETAIQTREPASRTAAARGGQHAVLV